MTDLAVIDTSAAERRALRIGLRLDAIADNYEAVMPLIREAIEMGDHATLGYASPGAYLSDRFGESLARLPLPVRRSAVAELSAAGLSTRAIAPVVGVNNATVHRDLARVASATREPEPDYVTDEADLIVNRETGEITDTPPKVTGLDGKSYSRPAPSAPRTPPRRTPLPDDARSAGWALRSAVERVESIGQDDRFNAHKEAVAPHLRSHLTNAIEVCQDLLDRINEQ